MADARTTGAPDLDHRGSRRLTGREELVWYLVAAATYIPTAMWQKGLLNWFVGPAWLVTVVSVGPPLWDRLRRGRQGGA